MSDILTAPGHSPLWTAGALAALTGRLARGEERDDAIGAAMLDADAFEAACLAEDAAKKAEAGNVVAAAVPVGAVFVDGWASGKPLEVDRVDNGRVHFKPNPEHGPDPVDWPLDQVLDGSRFAPVGP